MNAYIVFKADLLVNAEIMTNLKTGNEYAEAIVNRWNELPTKISVYAEDSSATYDAYSFFDTLNNSQNPMTFTAYVTSDQAVKYTRGTPYAVKQVLEDNLLGETTAFSETANKAAPDITLVKLVDGKDDEYVAATEVTEGQNAMFQCLDKAYLAKLAENGSIYKGTASHQPFASTDYSVDTEKGILTIFKEKLTLGDNSITIKVNGYQTVRLSVRYQKVLEEVELSVPASTEAGNAVVITCTTNHGDAACDFFANVTGVTLNRPDGTTKELSKDGVDSVFDEIGYTVNGDKLTLGKDLFSTVGNYSVTIRAGHGYASQTVNFAITEKEVTPDPEEAVPPTVAGVELVKGYDSYYRVSFSGDAEAYLNKVTGATVDGVICESKIIFSGDKQFKIGTNLSYGTKEFLDFTTDCFSATGETTVVVQATGYTDLTFKVKDGNLVTDGDSGEDSSKLSPPAFSSAEKVTPFGGDKYTRISFVGDENTVATYLALIETNHITVNGEAIGKISSFWNSTKNFKLSNHPTYGGKSIYLDITEDSFSASGNSIVVISVDGYNDLTFTINAQGNLVTK